MNRTYKILVVVLLLSVLRSPLSVCQAQNWTMFNMQNSELGNSVLAMTSDKKNNKWFGTDLGMARLTGKTWTDFAMFNEKLKGQYVNCLTVDANNMLWIGTDDYGVIEFDGSRWTEHKNEMKRLQMKFISKIAIDRNDVKWIGVTLGGLVRYDGREWTKYTSNDSELLSDFILCVAIDRRNRKWIGTNDGLSVYDDRQWTSYTTKNSKLPDNIVPAIIIDKEDVKWIATLGGLARYDGNGWTIFNTDNSPLPCNQINDLAFDPSGAIWMVTDKGAALFDGKDKWHIYRPKETMLPKDVLRRVMVDGQGSKWFGSSLQGLVRFSAQPVMGRVIDDKGNPVSGLTINCSGVETQTDANGEYYLEIPTNATMTIRPQDESRTFEPESRKLTTVTGALFGQDFVASSGMVAEGTSTEKVVVNPYLEQGYITITMESPVAEVEFVDAKGVSIRTIPQYKNEAKITISRMPKSNYTLFIRTAKGEKKLQFNLK
jgi:ligand-binding sensor domain-containing protein